MTTKFLALSIVAILITIIWLTRWEVVPLPMNDAPVAYQLDRWTGDVYLLLGPAQRERLKW